MKDAVVARGRIRIDARRAVEKLREHQLVDLHHYLHELVRAAVASGAASVELSFDADEVVVTWVGRPWPAASLPRLLDYVLTEATDDEAQRWRLLAMGVNAALGLAPRFVALEAADEEGVQRWRFAPAQLEEDAGPDPAAATPEAPVGWLRVHVARRLSWNVLRRFATRGAPPEITALLEATRDLPVPLVVAGQARPAERTRSALVAPLRLRGVAGIRRAELHISPGLTPTLRWLERGVDLALAPLPPLPGLPTGPIHGCRLPVAVVIDADTLPTNASRSALREDAPLAQAVARAIPRALVRAVEALRTAAGFAAQKPSTEPLVADLSVEAARDLLETMAVLAASDPDGEPALLSLPLLRGACGQPRPVSAARGGRRPIALHRGENAVDARLAEWMTEAFWLRGRTIDHVFTGLPTVEAGPLVAQAEEGWARREHFRSYPEVPVAVPVDDDHLLVEVIEVEEGPLAGLVGEVALDGAGLLAGREQSTVRVFVEQRELAALRLRGTPLPLDAAVSWSGLVPRSSYDGVEADEARDAVVAFVAEVGTRLVLELWERSRDAELTEAQSTVIRRAICAAIASAPERDALAVMKLAAVEAWPTLDGSHVGLRRILDERDRRRSLAWVPVGTEGSTVNDRLVLALDPEHHRWLRSIFGPEVELTPYEQAVIPPGGEAHHEAQLDRRLEETLVHRGLGGRPAVATVSIRRPGLRALMAVSSSSRLLLLHAGVLLETSREPQLLGGAIAAVEDDTIYPSADWKRVAWSGRTWSFASLEREQLLTIVAALEGEPAALVRCHFEGELGKDGYGYLLRSLVAAKTEAEGGDEELSQVAARIAGLPLVLMLLPDGTPTRVSLAEVARVHGDDTIPWLYHVPEFPTLDWHPLVLDRDEHALVDEWFGKRLRLATYQLGDRRARVAEEMEKHRLLARPAEAVTDLRDVATGEPRHTIRKEADEAEYPIEELSLSLASPDALALSSSVEVGYCGRYFTTVRGLDLDGPVSARMAFGPQAGLGDWIEGWKALTEAGEVVVKERIHHAAYDFAQARLTADREALFDPRLAALVASLLRARGDRGPPLRSVLRHRAHLPVAQGPEVEGGSARLGALRRAQGEVYISRKRYDQWPSGKGALDRPVLWMPADALGVGLEHILDALDIETRDVTSALDRLHARRTGALADVAPRLPGEPPGAGLRVDLQDLDEEDDLIGELELSDGRSSLSVSDLSGEVRDIPWAPFVPLRAVVRWDALPSEAVDRRLQRRLEGAGRRFLNELSKKPDELPPVGRRAVRRLIGDRLERRKRLSQALRRAAVFGDTTGSYWSLDELQAEGSPLWVTTQPPPYPERDRVVLRLPEEELTWLRTLLTRTVRDMTRQLRREVEAASRRTQAPRHEMGLATALAERCVLRRFLAEDDLYGEIGLLPPGVEGEGIAVHVDGRALCTVAMAGLVGVVDVPVEPNRFFDGFRRQSEREGLVARLQHHADEALRSHMQAPLEAAAEHWAEAVSVDGARLLGRFWLPASFPARASVAVWGPGMAQPSDVSLVQLAASSRLDRSVPIGGTVWLFSGNGEEDLHHFVTEQGLLAAAAMLETPTPGFDHDLYRWAFALLGVELSDPPAAELATGHRIGPDEVLTALQTEGVIWFSEGRGDTDGPFPEKLPSFVLRRGHDTGLIDLLERRATGPWLCELGGRELHADVEPPGAFDATELFAPQPIAAEVEVAAQAAAPRSTAPAPESAPGEETAEALVDPFWSGVSRRVRAWFGETRPPAPATTGLRSAIETRLARLPLPRGAVKGVGFSRRGRALRYDLPTRRIILHRDHPWVRRCLGDGAMPPEAGLERVAAAAVSEIHRARREVNRAIELEAILALLEER